MRRRDYECLDSFNRITFHFAKLIGISRVVYTGYICTKDPRDGKDNCLSFVLSHSL